MPSIGEIGSEVASASTTHFLECVGEFETFAEQGYTIIFEDPFIQIDFSFGQTLSSLIFPLTVTLEDKTTKISTFQSVIPFDFISKYDTIFGFLEEQENDPNYFLVGSLSSLAYENKFGLEFGQQGDLGSEVLLSLSFDDGLKEEPVLYNFGLLYDWDHQTVEITDQESIIKDLSLSYIEPLHITQPGIHTYQIEAQGENITFETDTTDFILDAQTGLITLNTVEFVNDEYWYFVRVRDAYNREVTAPFYLDVNVNEGKFPIIDHIGELHANVEEAFEYTITILNNENERPLFFDDTYSQFPINKQTGYLEFVPTQDMRGTYSLRVDVENEFGRTWQRFTIVIE
jgi:hypothetical protein